MEKDDIKIILNNRGVSKMTSKEVTYTLKQFGLATSQSSVARYIREEKLKGEPILVEKNGEQVFDKREGYRVAEKDLYKFVVERMPGVESLWKEINALQKENNELRKELKKNEKESKEG